MRLSKYRGNYCVYWREGGQPVRRSLGTADQHEALRRFESFKAGLAEAATNGNHTVADLWEARRKALEGRRMASNMEWSGRSILPHFGHLRASQVSEALVSDYIRQRNRAPGTLWTELNHLRSTLTWALKKDLIQRVPSFPLPSRPPPKTDYLTKEQARVFLSHCRFPHVHLFCTLALATGARSGALLELTWDRVDLDKRLIHLRTQDMENKKGRATVPVNSMAFTALQAAKEHRSCPYVIEWAGDRVRFIRRGIKAVALTTGLTFVTPHVFRHSSAVWMAEAGVPMEEIAQFLGHSNVEITRKVYARYSPTYLKKAAEALEL